VWPTLPDKADIICVCVCVFDVATGFDIESDLSSHEPWEQWDAAPLPAALSAGASYDLPYDTLEPQAFGDGSLSPALISTAPAGNSLGGNWWLSSSPAAGVFGSGSVF
jgi:hypothetical protein